MSTKGNLQANESLALDPNLLKKTIIRQSEHRNPPPSKFRRSSHEENYVHSLTKSNDTPLSFRLSHNKRNESESQ